MLAALRDRHVDLGYDKYRERQSYLRRTLRELRRGRLNFSTPGLSTRFEFSALPADGGFLPPHTDAPSKIVTLVFSMADEEESWDPAWGGALDVNEPREDRSVFNYHNRLADYADMEMVRSFPYRPNQCVVFVKTYNSWHPIKPMTGKGVAALRKTLTIKHRDRRLKDGRPHRPEAVSTFTVEANEPLRPSGALARPGCARDVSVMVARSPSAARSREFAGSGDLPACAHSLKTLSSTDNSHARQHRRISVQLADLFIPDCD